MKIRGCWILAVALAGAGCNEIGQSGSAEVEFDRAAYEEQKRQEAEARSNDPDWKPLYDELTRIQVGESREKAALKNFCLSDDGNILACWAPASGEKGLRVYSPEGELLKTWKLPIGPTAVASVKGQIFAAGEGKLLRLDSSGSVVASVDSPVISMPLELSEDIEAMIEEEAKQGGRSVDSEKKRMLQMLKERRGQVTALALTDTDVFMAVPAPNDFSYQVHRFDHSLKESKLVLERLRGCCSQMDIQAGKDGFWVAHNGRHRVESYDRDGKQLSKFGTRGKVKPSDFGGCCEPKCMRVLPDGELLVAESGPPTCIKRFSADGKFLGVLAVVDAMDGDCVKVTVARSADGKRFYMLDTTTGSIRVFGAAG